MPRLYNDEIWGNVRDTQNIPTNIKNKIIAHVETGLDGYKVVNVDVVDDMIEVAYFAYSMGWKDGFMDINQEPDTKTQTQMRERDKSIMEALEKLKRTIDNNRMVFNYGGTK